MKKANRRKPLLVVGVVALSLILGIWIEQQGGLSLLINRTISFFVSPIKKDQYLVKKVGNPCLDTHWAGDLWIYSNNKSEPKQITKGLCIGEILGLSPDKRYIAGTIEGWNGGSRTTSLAIVELGTGDVKVIKPGSQYANYGVGYWLSNIDLVNFIAPKIGENNLKIESINIKNKDSKIIGEWPIGVLFSGNQPFSENKQWAVGNGYNMDEQKPYTVELFSYDQRSKTKNSIIDGKFIKFITWFGNKIIYADKVEGKNTIWAIDANGVNKEKLGNLEGEEISNFAVTGDHKRFIYSVKTKKTNTPEIDVDHNWFSFDLINKENKKLDFDESFVAIQSLSRDGDLGAFVKKDSHELFIVDLTLLKSNKLCWAGDNCQVVWP
ncbi:MAG: hypothetical protein ABII08_01980 [Candidatus Beckwithbacteria bacterium]